jgi:hypothetical protein
MSKDQVQKKPLEKPKAVKLTPIDATIPKIKATGKKTQKPVILQNAKPQEESEKVIRTRMKKPKILDLPEEHEKYFVYLKNPMEYRRQLLECSRKILYCLRSNQKIALIRQKKIEEMKTLKVSIKELIYLNKKFNEMLPKYHTRFLEGIASEDKNKPVNIRSPTFRKPAEIKQDRTEMEKLEESLANIEKKLRSLQ